MCCVWRVCQAEVTSLGASLSRVLEVYLKLSVTACLNDVMFHFRRRSHQVLGGVNHVHRTLKQLADRFHLQLSLGSAGKEGNHNLVLSSKVSEEQQVPICVRQSLGSARMTNYCGLVGRRLKRKQRTQKIKNLFISKNVDRPSARNVTRQNLKAQVMSNMLICSGGGRQTEFIDEYLSSTQEIGKWSASSVPRQFALWT